MLEKIKNSKKNMFYELNVEKTCENEANFYVVMCDSMSIRNAIIEKKIHNCFNRLSNVTKSFLSNFDIRISICNIKNTYGVYGRGSYVPYTYNDMNCFLICIDNSSIRDIEFVLFHELGHFMDGVIGCIINGVEINQNNLKKYKISCTQKEYQEIVCSTHDFFTQFDRSNNVEMDNHDYAEIFADCFAEITLGKRTFSQVAIKRVIYGLTKPIIENFDFDSKNIAI